MVVPCSSIGSAVSSGGGGKDGIGAITVAPGGGASASSWSSCWEARMVVPCSSVPSGAAAAARFTGAMLMVS